MRYTFFDILNYKGIESVHLSLLEPPQRNVHTLIGLNESGKTTILEAINLLRYRESLDALDLPGYGQRDPHELIPIAKRANFNGEITIKAGVSMTEADHRWIAAQLLDEIGVRAITLNTSFEIVQTYKFSASRVVEAKPAVNWIDINLKGLTGKARTAHRLKGQEWGAAVRVINRILPKIAYFPNFLFDFPDRIYLEKVAENEEKHIFYRRVLQDVLDALGDGLTLNDHVLARANSTEMFDKRSLESVLLKMGAHITRTVFSQWNSIFKRKAGGKEIKVNIGRDVDNGAWYLQLRLNDNNELYEISERSLGFRWFFTYLLLTQYRGFRQSEGNAVLFLFDEPASNLHPSAQVQLLDSFAQLPQNAGVIYTTHSHHLIKPDWLEGAFVVKNEGLEYGVDYADFTSRRTLITLHRYRDFAAHHPNQVTYFQPILDVLDYAPSELENIPAVVMLEGKSDFYVLRLMQQTLTTGALCLLPGGGAGSLDSVIQLYIGWARHFIVLLDSDKAGQKQRERYIDKFGESLRKSIVLPAEVDDTLKEKGIECLFEPDELLAIQQSAYPAAIAYNKTHFHRAIQELLLTRKPFSISTQTSQRFRALLHTLSKRLSDNAIATSA